MVKTACNAESFKAKGLRCNQQTTLRGRDFVAALGMNIRTIEHTLDKTRLTRMYLSSYPLESKKKANLSLNITHTLTH